MTDFETELNDLLVDTFDTILKYEAQAMQSLSGVSTTIGEAHMIECIARLEDAATVSQITTAMQLAMPTVTIAVKKLEAKGYVVKVPCERDGRRSYIRLTPDGERINRAHSIFHQRMVRRISDQFEPFEKDILLTAISKLNDYFQRQTKAAQ